MRLLKQALFTTLLFLSNSALVHSQSSYDWREHNDAMEDVSTKDIGLGSLVFICAFIFLKILTSTPTKKVSNKNLNSKPKDHYTMAKFGELKETNGVAYEGELKNGEKHGYGTEVKTSFFGGPKTVTRGNWKNNKIHGIHEYTVDSLYTNRLYFKGEKFEFNGSYQDIEVYESQYKEIKKCRSYVTAKGRWVHHRLWEESEIREGEIRMVEFYQNRFDVCFLGKVTYTMDEYGGASKGDVYEGMLRREKRDGIGKMIYVNGEVFYGKWRHGNKIESLT